MAVVGTGASVSVVVDEEPPSAAISTMATINAARPDSPRRRGRRHGRLGSYSAGMNGIGSSTIAANRIVGDGCGQSGRRCARGAHRRTTSGERRDRPPGRRSIGNERTEDADLGRVGWRLGGRRFDGDRCEETGTSHLGVRIDGDRIPVGSWRSRSRSDSGAKRRWATASQGGHPRRRPRHRSRTVGAAASSRSAEPVDRRPGARRPTTGCRRPGRRRPDRVLGRVDRSVTQVDLVGEVDTIGGHRGLIDHCLVLAGRSLVAERWRWLRTHLSESTT